MNDVPTAAGFSQGDRNARRNAEKLERTARATGKWAPWAEVRTPPGFWTALGGEHFSPRAWMLDVHTVHRNGWCVVMVRDCRTRIGYVKHAIIKTATDSGLTWGEKQRVKNEIFGPISTAIEVFPAEDRLIDEAPIYHLWILPLDFQLPFGLAKADPCSDSHYRP